MADFPQPAWSDILARPIAFHPVFADITGSIKAAIMLSQAFYWQKRNPEGGWWFKTREAWWRETRLTRREQEQARKVLRGKGFLLEKKTGVPAKLYFMVDFDAIGAEISSLHKTAQLRGAETAILERAETAQLDGTEPPNTYESKDETYSVSLKQSPPVSDWAEFWGCWSITGTKKGKAEAKRLYDRIIKRREATHEQLCSGVRRLMRASLTAGTEARFIKHPATWLNQGCWDDEHAPCNGVFGQAPQRKRPQLLDVLAATESSFPGSNPKDGGH